MNKAIFSYHEITLTCSTYNSNTFRLLRHKPDIHGRHIDLEYDKRNVEHFRTS